jgi:stearoyl-CoA desaturase (delta-9 desaturase)
MNPEIGVVAPMAAVNVKDPTERISWVSSLPFIGVHFACLLAFLTPVHARDIIVCVALYFVRMFAVTGGLHRYFSHRSYKTSRAFQFVLAVLGTVTVQKGILWWAGHHRHHHKESDQPADIHSPMLKGFVWSHVGWILCPKYNETPMETMKDFTQYPELRWLNKHFLIPPVAMAVALFFIGGLSMLTWGFFISTVLLWHGTFTINSLSHIFGKRRYKTTDTSRNNWFLALVTMGEGWHNNHHYHQSSVKMGWFWWEVDATYYVLRALSAVGIVWDLKKPSANVKNAYLKYSEEDRLKLSSRTPFGGAPVAEMPVAQGLDLAAPQPLLKHG